MMIKISQFILFSALFFVTNLSLNAQVVVINEVDALVAESPQFVELSGVPNMALDGFSLALVKSSWLGGGAYGIEVYDAMLLDGQQLNSEGFWSVALEMNITIAAVAIYESDLSAIIVGEAPPTDAIVDALVYGNTSPTHPQAAILIQALMPLGSGILYEGAEENSQGHSLSRLPNGGESFDLSAYVLQPPSQGVSNILECDGGSLELTNLANDTLCTDQGPAIATFVHNTNAPTGDLTLFIVDPESGNILSSASGSAINFQGMGDGLLEVIAVSHNLPLDSASMSEGMPISNLSGPDCLSISSFPYEIFCITCESPACDGGTMLDASGSEEVLACLTPDGALVPFGYYSEAVEDEFVFAICTVDDTIITTVSQPYFDFGTLGVNDYHVWGISTQGDLDTLSISAGSYVQFASAEECDSVGASALLVSILECGDAGLCDDLIISEYIEGDSHNKAIEIHNPSPITIDLAEYSLELYNNGATDPNQVLDLQGQILPGDVFVVGNSQSVASLQNMADVTSQVTWYNGNDALALLKNGVPIDVLGVIGVDPGDPWTVSSGGAMAEYTLVRKPNIGQGTTDWEEGMTQWDSYPQDTFDFLGSHSATCGGLGEMTIGFDAPELYVSEGGGIEVSMSPFYPLENAIVEVSIVGGDAVIGIDYPDVFPLNFNFEIGQLNSQSFVFSAIDEEEPELQEDVILALEITSGGAILGIDTLVIHILPSDLDYPVYEINQVRGVNPQGVLDSIGTACELRGIVHGWNDYPSGLQFTLIDPTNGINVFSPVSDFGYSVVEGDSIRVRGVIDQYLGLAQIRIDTLIFEGSGFPSDTPQLVFEMDEETESRIITLKCTHLVDTLDWTNTTPGFDVRLAFGAQEIIMRIDANTDLFGTDVPLGTFGVTGIGGQRDPNSPFVDGYTIAPRGQSDLTEPVNADFTVVSPWDMSLGPIELENLSTGASGYLWYMGDGESYNDETPIHTYSEGGTFSISLTAFSQDGNCSNQTIVEIVSIWVGVDEITSLDILAYPNPTSKTINITSPSPVLGWEVVDSQGRVVKSGGSTSSTVFDIDASQLRAGFYTINVNTEIGKGFVRFVRN
ncbi:MAG: hypothetical protein COA49_02815 [Bacteroidetes bacterium]|nr:MAG: hypothetical protein COA49_02815 [Bacteroidota bacterium]